MSDLVKDCLKLDKAVNDIKHCIDKASNIASELAVKHDLPSKEPEKVINILKCKLADKLMYDGK